MWRLFIEFDSHKGYAKQLNSNACKFCVFFWFQYEYHIVFQLRASPFIYIHFRISKRFRHFLPKKIIAQGICRTHTHRFHNDFKKFHHVEVFVAVDTVLRKTLTPYLLTAWKQLMRICKFDDMFDSFSRWLMQIRIRGRNEKEMHLISPMRWKWEISWIEWLKMEAP